MFEHLLRPGRINTLETKHRIMVAPMEKSMANPDGSLSERYIEYVTERARGGASLIQLESTYVDEGGRGNPYQVGCHHDGVIPGLTKLADILHSYGAQLSLELHHGGRQASPSASGRQPIAPSSIGSTAMGPDAVPRAMTGSDIQSVISAYARAAERCVAAGVDMINLHGAHGYLLGQFLSPQSNHRTDEYGGSLENRARLALEVLAAVRDVVGPDYPISYRISAVEFVEGGLELDESIKFAVMLREAGIDMVDVAGGTYESMEMIFHGSAAPRGGFIPYAAAIKKAVGDLPVGVAQKLNDPIFTEQAMIDNNLDFISLARGFHADPHFVRKLQRGAPEDILPCIACNACLWMSVGRTPVLCAANPHTNFEEKRRIHPAAAPKSVLVVGGGVAGMHAARILARQGHEVTLAEAESRLGGQINHSKLTQPDHEDLVSWLARQLDNHHVTVSLATEVTVDYVRDADPDSVVVAVGAGGAPSRLRSDDGSASVLDVFQGFNAASTLAGPVVITTGDSASCQLALLLAARGLEVHLVEASGQLAGDRPSPLDSTVAAQIAKHPTIHVYTSSTVESVAEGFITGQTRGAEFRAPVRTLVIGGRVSRFELAQKLKNAGIRSSVHAIGDGVTARDIFWASFDAAEAADAVNEEVVLKHPMIEHHKTKELS